MKRNRLLLTILSLFIGLSVFIVSPKQEIVSAAENKTIEYIAKEDAFVRSGGKGNTNYDFENITSTHGAQYAGKGYTVINSKYTPSDEIIGIMKFDLPTKQEVEEYALDTFEFEFNVFKNAGFKNGAQDFGFYYTTDMSWDETVITYNTKPESISRSSENELFTFHTDKDEEYEIKKDSEKRITTDISETIKQLIEDGNTEITIFVVGKQNSSVSLLLHSRETKAINKSPKLIASNETYDLQNLKDLVESTPSVKQEEYTTDSYTIFEDYLNVSNKLIADNSTDAFAIKIAYRNFKKAYDGLEKIVIDDENVAFNKPTRSNLSKKATNLVTDGDIKTSWSGTSFPAYVDIDLMDTYNLDKLQIYVPEGKIIYYTIYGSNDGNNYDRLHQHRVDEKATAEGNEIIFDTPQSYRIIRVFLEFTDGEITSHLSEVKAYGEKTDSNTEVLRDGTLEEILDVKAFNQTAYAAPITNDETIENVYGIIDRTVGPEYRSWFTFEIADETSENDYFELSDVNGKIHIKGNEGLSLTTGLNYYYKNYVKVHISEQTMQVNMPEAIVPIGKTVRKETPYQVRYAFNYCTLSYTFAFFGEEEWQRENDWLALNGVNVVLDLAGQEATWIQFLMNFGYSYDDAKDWLTGPSYSAWQFMNNMETLGGPVPDGYVKDRLELARSSQRWKNSLGMQTVLQGYGGMVPTNFNEFQPNVEVTKQKNWGGNLRPSMIATDSATYDEYAEKFYAAQEFVYGDTSDYYAVDPYHEGGTRPEGLSDETVSKEVLESLLKYDKDAVWVVQAWQSNPTNGLLKGMGEYRNDHVLIVDLIKYPLKSWTKYDRTKYGSTTLDSKEFNGTDWAWCLLGNFGGNPTMNGQMQVMVDDVLKAQKESKHMKGIGIISEGTYDNPVLYDLIFDLAWADEDFDLNQWLNGYIERRYGGISENARLAWQMMKDSNYNHGVRHTEEIFGLKNSRPQFQSTKNISYGADKLETAFKLLAEDYDKFKDSECYLYDLREIMRQHVSNYAVLSNNNLITAKNNGSLEAYSAEKEKFLKAFDVLNEVQATDKDQLAGEWIGKATDRVADYDDFSKDLFKINAKTLITTWGTNPNAGLKEYGWRNYEGMFLDLHKHHWEEYVNLVENDLANGTTTEPRSQRYHFDYEWKWVLGDQEYSRTAKDSPEEVRAVVDMVIENCSITEGLSPDAGNLALNKPVDVNSKKITGKSRFATDGNTDTSITVSATKEKDKVVKPEVIVDLVAEFQLSKVNIVFNDIEDRYYNYEVYISTNGKDWTKIGEKTSEELHSESGDIITVNNDMARFVKVVGTKDSKHLDNEEKMEISIKELRVYGERTLPDAEQLTRFINAIEELNLNSNSSSQIEQLEKLIQNAEDAIEQGAGPDDLNSVYWNLYDHLVSLDLNGMVNLALNKPVEAHNGTAGEPTKINDGDIGTGWNAGRLSPTGKPYQHDPIVPGWAIIDLEGDYNIEEIRLKFPSGSLWYKYEIYVSKDGEKWDKYSEKTTENLPNDKEDNYLLEKRNIRYIKVVPTDITVGSDGKRASYGIRELEVYGSLYEKANTESLEKLIDEISKLDKDAYTQESWQVLETSLDEAKSIIKQEDVLQSEVDVAYDKLSDAKDALVEKTLVDLTKLEETITVAKSFDLNNYTEESANKLLTAINKAEELVKGTPTQKEVDDMTKELQGAIDELEVNKPSELDTVKLNDLINSVSKIDLSKYTTESVDVLNKALENAKTAVETASSQEEIDNAYNELSKAIKDLKVKSSPTEKPKPGDNGNPANDPKTNDSASENESISGTDTGDTTNLSLLLGMLVLSMGYIVYRKKKNSIRK
ncbi:alpha-N-acetylglucosaminidase TIM-barrel domain-containing protein [Breznakia pachnodae]|uniref:LPXTG-motif cell wall-anchored protein n=1 Tax=Breznakia pachnodae TaxID=265178 RepID=A0ABU0E690_9FIRM|nr:alpha-N-acetylglucosaminidase TIM-barrel domain-containing protein [Breznakia pachnodae]MDQ0362310.1 LPXTG-motif cell wall-anchored protein [Breznakia pachnodae]